MQAEHYIITYGLTTPARLTETRPWIVHGWQHDISPLRSPRQRSSAERPPAPAAGDDGLRVVASIKPVHSLVSAVMAGVGEPHLIIRGRASPHTFTMRPSDAAALEDADIVFMIGDTMETALSGPVETLAGDAPVVRLADAPGLVLRTIREGGAFEDHDHGSHGHGGHVDEAMHRDDHDDHGHGHGHDDHD